MMSVVRRRRIRVIILAVIVAAAIVSLALLALRQNIDVYYTPHQLVEGKVFPSHTIRLGGWVKKHSIVHDINSTRMHFLITDHMQSVPVDYNGLLPSLFREGQGVVVVGHFVKGRFKAKEVLAKHDANYHPPGMPRVNKMDPQRIRSANRGTSGGGIRSANRGKTPNTSHASASADPGDPKELGDSNAR